MTENKRKYVLTLVCLLTLSLIFLGNYHVNIFTDYKIEDPKENEYYKKGLKALEENNYLQAEEYFIMSIRKFSDAPSHYELGKLYVQKATPLWRNKALEHFKQAVWKDSANLDYRYAYASLLEDFARFNAIEQYKRIIEIDNKQIEAWNRLAKMKEDDFKEFHNSVRNMEGFMGSLEEFALEDFTEAEAYLKKVLSIDSLNFDANYKLGQLYENAELFDKAIPFIERCISVQPEDKNTHLFLALLMYKTSNLERSNSEYLKSFSLMSREERKEFAFHSAKFLLEPAFEDIMRKYEDWETEQFIDSYWEINDPLYLTEYNERVLEHYSRVAYAKIHFTVPDMNINGWKSNMGEFVLRYGEPGKRMRIRPQMGANGVDMLTEVWYYNDMTLAFTDFALSGNYQFSTPSPDKWKFKSQYGGDSQWFAENLKTIKHDNYIPRYEGPTFEVPYDIVQFRSSSDRNKTDVYINYGLNLTDSTFTAANINYDHKLGLFFFDRYHRQLYERKKDVLSSQLSDNKLKIVNNELLVNSARMTVQPDSGIFSLELLREGDKGVFVDRFKLVTEKFTKDGFNISNVLLATAVDTRTEKNYLIRRSNHSIQPNPTHSFSSDIPLYLYFEVYGLEIGEDRLTDFEQEIKISRVGRVEGESGVSNFFNSVLSFFGLGSDDTIALTSQYQTLETDPQIYLQVDMSKYEPGEYLITVTIHDEISGKEASTSTVILWE